MAAYKDLEQTADLVMLWARDLYRTGSAASRFYSLLDLSAGEKMRQECELACPWYSEVILNRKWWIRQLADEFIAAGPCQVILLASGKSPLALELLDDCGDRIASVTEVDICGMEKKQNLYRLAAPEPARKIRCVAADISDIHRLSGAVRETCGYDPGLPICIIAEGISYYIPPAHLAAIVSCFASGTGKNRLILDYLLPCRLVSREQRRFPRGVWRVINHECSPGGTFTYTPEALDMAFARAGFSHVVHHSLHEMERRRTGTNHYFSGETDGWIRIAMGWL
jgi:O-methyltransferase involved in polyketide biosynthesis